MELRASLIVQSFPRRATDASGKSGYRRCNAVSHLTVVVDSTGVHAAMRVVRRPTFIADHSQVGLPVGLHVQRTPTCIRPSYAEQLGPH